MRKLHKTPYYSMVVGRMPDGCRLCVKGAKLVLFATGLCSRHCWYCPLSERKKNKDVVIANEWWVRRDRDVIEEARLCNSLGAGITGGDPLMRMDRTVHYIRLLKKTFGSDFHIHLYTSGALASERNLSRLYSAGLDELRFHPLKKDFPALVSALKFGWKVGCEIPAIPGTLAATRDFIRYIDGIGVNFLNINELEFSETNMQQMLSHGMKTAGGVSYAIKGSDRLAHKLLDYCRKETSLDVHYCTLKLKDKVQLGNRLKRRAKNAAKEYDITTKEGLFVRGAIYLPELLPSFKYQKTLDSLTSKQSFGYLKRLMAAKAMLKRKYNLPTELIGIDRQRFRLLTGAWIVEELAPSLKESGLKPAVVEEYPTWDALCVDLRFL
ncbi:MAG: radical SAM protein [Candidatus Altiarchaeota archaeon]|nr:radical SAM protein [Candidatus Altiarchaeota archaeon]